MTTLPDDGPDPTATAVEKSEDDDLVSLYDMLATGVSYRRLDYWVRQGYIRPALGAPLPGSGQARRWTRRDLEVVRRIVAFTEAGVDAAAAARWATDAVDDGRDSATVETVSGRLTLSWTFDAP